MVQLMLLSYGSFFGGGGFSKHLEHQCVMFQTLMIKESEFPSHHCPDINARITFLLHSLIQL